MPWCPGVMEEQAVSGAPSLWPSTTTPAAKAETIAIAARIIVNC